MGDLDAETKQMPTERKLCEDGAEIGVLRPQARSYQIGRGEEEARKISPGRLWKEHGPPDTWILDFWPWEL